ncbi:MAG TPA: type VII secretion protein EccE, partial [Mycobacterium sp.]|nr:type VII secretion protein EccE [Mycobacterium sp.]
GLTPQRGNHRPALIALDPSSALRLDGHTDLPADLLERLRWPAGMVRPGRASRGPRHAAAARN